MIPALVATVDELVAGYAIDMTTKAIAVNGYFTFHCPFMPAIPAAHGIGPCVEKVRYCLSYHALLTYPQQFAEGCYVLVEAAITIPDLF